MNALKRHPHRVVPFVRLALAATMFWIACGAAAAQPAPIAIASVRLDEAFRLTGSNSMGLVVAVRINELKPRTTSGQFHLRLYDDAGRPAGDQECLAMRPLDDADPTPKWILLDGPEGTLERSYAGMLKAGAAILQKGRTRGIEQTGRYEFVFLIGPTAKQGALVYGENRPGVALLPVDSFKVPWP